MTNITRIRRLAEEILAEVNADPPRDVDPAGLRGKPAIEWAMRTEPPSKVWSPKEVASRLEVAGRRPWDPSTDMWDRAAAGQLRRLGHGMYQLP